MEVIYRKGGTDPWEFSLAYKNYCESTNIFGLMGW